MLMTGFVKVVKESIDRAHQNKVQIDEEDNDIKCLIAEEETKTVNEINQLLSAIQESPHLEEKKATIYELQPFITFLANRHNRIQKSAAHYLNSPNTAANLLCMSLAGWITLALPNHKNAKSILQLIIPSLKEDLTDSNQLSSVILNDRNTYFIHVYDVLKRMMQQKKKSLNLVWERGDPLRESEIERVINFSKETKEYYDAILQEDVDRINQAEKKLLASFNQTNLPKLYSYKNGKKRLIKQLFPDWEALHTFLLTVKPATQVLILQALSADDLSLYLLNHDTLEPQFVSKLFNCSEIMHRSHDVLCPIKLQAFACLMRKWLTSHTMPWHRNMHQLNIYFYSSEWSVNFNQAIYPYLGDQKALKESMVICVSDSVRFLQLFNLSPRENWGQLFRLFSFDKLQELCLGINVSPVEFKNRFFQVLQQEDEYEEDFEVSLFIYKRLYLAWLNNIDNKIEKIIEELTLYRQCVMANQTNEAKNKKSLLAYFYKEIIDDISIPRILISSLKSEIKQYSQLILALKKLPKEVWNDLMLHISAEELGKLCFKKETTVDMFDALFNKHIMELNLSEKEILREKFLICKSLYLKWRPKQDDYKYSFLRYKMGIPRKIKLNFIEIVGLFLMSDYAFNEFDIFFKQHVTQNGFSQEYIEKLKSARNTGVVKVFMDKLGEAGKVMLAPADNSIPSLREGRV